MERLISPATGGMLWSHLAKCSLLLSIQAKLDCRYLTLVGTLRAMAGHTGRAWGDSSDRRVKALPICDWTIRRPPQV